MRDWPNKYTWVVVKNLLLNKKLKEKLDLANRKVIEVLEIKKSQKTQSNSHPPNPLNNAAQLKELEKLRIEEQKNLYKTLELLSFRSLEQETEGKGGKQSRVGGERTELERSLMRELTEAYKVIKGLSVREFEHE